MSDEKQNSEEDLIMIRGCPFSTMFGKKNIEDAMDYLPKDDDVVIVSFPKTGTTWLQYIVLQIISAGESFPTFDDVTYKVVPFIEMSGISAVEALESQPRIYKHHIRYDLVQKNEKAKYIYIYRHPEDSIVSFYYFIKSFKFEPFDQDEFNKFFDDFIDGKVSYGNYFRHILAFYDHRNDDNLLLLTYEKLQASRREEILRIAKYLGGEYHQCLLENEDILNKVIQHTSFDYMKKNLYLSFPKNFPVSESEEKPKVNFFRKGIVGDGKNILTNDQRERLKNAAQKVLNGTPIIDEWYPD